MALFGRRSARQRLRSAARESLTIPAFSAPVDCSAWVLGGLWPAELATVTPATAQLAEYLDADLRRIADSANEKLHAIGRSGLAGQARQTAESRVINVARAFAVLRVESTVRYLHNEALEFRPPYASLNSAPPPAAVTEQIPAPVEPEPVAVELPRPVDPPREAPRPAARHRMPEPVVVEPVPEPEPAPVPEVVEPEVAEPVVVEPVVVPPAVAEPVPVPPVVVPPIVLPPVVVEPVIVEPVVEEPVVEPVVEPPAAGVLPVEVVPVVELPFVEAPAVAPPPEPVVAPPPDPAPVMPESSEPTVLIPAEPEPPVVPATPPPAPPAVAESDDQRLQRLLAFVARQEPGLSWAVGSFADGKTVLVTDLAHGWIPSGIELPAEVHLLGPEQRTGTAAAMLGDATASAIYHPGDRLGWASDFGVTEASVQPRELDAVDDLGWQLSEATHWRDGLPRMANTLVKAGATGTGVADAEIDLLRVHLDTVRYQLLAQYPDADAALVLNCMLLAATEGIAAGDGVSANYHYSWFRALSTPQPSQWDPQK
ncbi:DUF5631 domain-containing protein [[Mycobacterium] vasticus]|uniref:DUF5631 domain-containing protein n=1 Tax=[Mycobacterium] vasticus TaxID=2875777 RepID=A0ABU5YWT5_9MYCO|nr:DUF5631 domain-containing protein [Mycolicibacter sp. MYC017]MEB3069316.1 DUF5631 domain-containing protein [Mycolicibacter sp. MYC017]